MYTCPQEVLEATALRRDLDKLVHKVAPIDDVKHEMLVWPATAQIKYDGVYTAWIVVNGQALAISRTGKPLQNIEIDVAAFAQDGVYICETTNAHFSLEELSGCLNPNRVEKLDWERASTMRQCRYYFHDYLELDEFIQGYSHVPYYARHTDLFTLLDVTVPCVFLVASWEVPDIDAFEARADAAIADGHEGMVLKQYTAMWQAGKKDYQYTKRVRGLHVDLVCTGAEFGKGKREHQIAKLHFEYNGKPFAADLGRGWDDEKRNEMTAAYLVGQYGGARTLYPVGKVFHVKALQESSKGVLRLPKVEEMRIDKGMDDEIS